MIRLNIKEISPSGSSSTKIVTGASEAKNHTPKASVPVRIDSSVERQAKYDCSRLMESSDPLDRERYWRKR